MSLMHLHFHHDSSIGFSPYEGEYRVFELERFTKKRYFALEFIDDEVLAEEWDKNLAEECFKYVAECIAREYGVQYLTITRLTYDQVINIKTHVVKELFSILHKHFDIQCNSTPVEHHEAHALSAFYQSPYKEALVFSYDGGGRKVAPYEMEYTTVWYVNRNAYHNKLHNLPYSPVSFYGALGYRCKDTYQGRWLSIAGKAMGLQSYGVSDPELYSKLYPAFFGVNKLGWNLHGNCADVNSDFLNETIKNSFNGTTDKLEFWDASRLLATSQHVFEDVIIRTIEPYAEKYQLPIVLTGGGALNVICNSRIKNHFKLPTFVPCNPNDVGVALGPLFKYRNPQYQVKVTYNNFDLFDRDKLDHYAKERKAIVYKNSDLVKLIREGKIIGVVRGKSECGPRALGNRSILCDPSFANMKDILNSKVKDREWYRPFAPVVLEEKASEYFVWDGSPSPFMSFSTHVKMEYQQQLASVTHVDFTARLQTVNKEDNQWLYNLLKDMESTGLPVLLNTSFNIKGKPILNSIEDALHVLDNTQLDYVVVEEFLFAKDK